MDQQQLLAPGVWTDAAGTLHIDIGTILAAGRFRDTPANREMLKNAAIELFAERYPEAVVTVEE
jgi:hypothetical protein